MAYRISYLDAMRSARLVAVAETLDGAHMVTDQVTAAVPQVADRLVIAEDPLLSVASRVVQPPQSLDAAAGLSVLYLGGTISPDRRSSSTRAASVPSVATMRRWSRSPGSAGTCGEPTSRCSGSKAPTPTR